MLLEVVVHLGTFRLLFYEHYEFGHTINLTYCFLSTIVGKLAYSNTGIHSLSPALAEQLLLRWMGKQTEIVNSNATLWRPKPVSDMVMYLNLPTPKSDKVKSVWHSHPLCLRPPSYDWLSVTDTHKHKQHMVCNANCISLWQCHMRVQSNYNWPTL